MRSVKARGMDDLRRFRVRVNKAHAMDRIARPDRDYLIGKLDELEARVVNMTELNERGEEEG